MMLNQVGLKDYIKYRTDKVSVHCFFIEHVVESAVARIGYSDRDREYQGHDAFKIEDHIQACGPQSGFLSEECAVKRWCEHQALDGKHVSSKHEIAYEDRSSIIDSDLCHCRILYRERTEQCGVLLQTSWKDIYYRLSERSI